MEENKPINENAASSAPEQSQAQTPAQANSAPAASPAPASTNLPPIFTAAPTINQKRPTAKFGKSDMVFFVIILLFSIFAADFTFWGNFNLGFSISHFIFMVITTVYLSSQKPNFSAYGIFCGIASVVLSASFGYIRDYTLSFIAFFAIAALTAVYIFSLWGAPHHSTGSYKTCFDVLRYIIAIPIGKIAEPFRAMFDKENNSTSKSRKIIIGLFIALPLLCTVVPLLISSDIAFETLVQSVLSDPKSMVGYTVVGIILFPFIMSLLFAVNKNLDRRDSVRYEKPHKTLDGTVINTVLIVLSVVYIIYLLSQLSYFFGAFSQSLAENYTYSEYARRGFFELCWISAINLAVIFLSLVLSKLSDGKFPRLTKYLNLFLAFFTVLIIFTAESKMVLYIRAFGMTRLRILVSCFMIIMLAAFIMAAVTLFKPKFGYMKGIVIVAAIVLTAVLYANVDGIVAKYNISAYESGALAEIDLDTLYYLGGSSTGEIAKLLDSEDKSVRDGANETLYNRLLTYYYSVEEDGKINEQVFSIRDYNYFTVNEKNILRDLYESGDIYMPETKTTEVIF